MGCSDSWTPWSPRGFWGPGTETWSWWTIAAPGFWIKCRAMSPIPPRNGLKKNTHKMSDIQQRIKALREELDAHNHNYYVLDAPSISDYAFDMKLKELQALEAAHPEFYDPDSPSLRVGGAVTKNFRTVAHQWRMYSLDNSYSLED